MGLVKITQENVNSLVGAVNNRAKKADVYTKIETEAKIVELAPATDISAKQDKLIAGLNITIGADGKTISANDSSVAFTEITGKPTTLSGYGITDAAGRSIARPTKVSATSINVNGTVLTLSSPVSGEDYYFSTTSITTVADANTIGGFHFGVIPVGFTAINNITTSDAEAIRGINAYSIWTKWFRPSCDPKGMIYAAGKWFDIYLLNTDHHLYGTSAAGKTIAGGEALNGRNFPKIPLFYGGDGTTTYGTLTAFEAMEIGKAYGKDMISYEEFCAIAYGVLEASSAGAADTGVTQHLANYTSKFGLCMATGCQWIWSSELGRSTGATYTWKANTEGRGSLYSDENGPMSALFGGTRDATTYSGSRASYWSNPFWYTYWTIGCRYACNHLELA
jgi:hypothetical protein